MTTETTYQALRLFLSSPGDVEKERSMAEQVVQDVSRVCGEILGVHLEIIKWEHMLPMAPNEESVQDIINKEVRKSQVFIVILNKRFGTPAPGFKKSNTQREIETALDMIKEDKQKKFLAYFREVPPTDDAGPQQSKVTQLKKELEKRGILYYRYFTPDMFKYAFTNHLYETALRFRHSTFKHAALKSFWQIGNPERYTRPRLAVLYPSFDRPHISKPIQNDWWLRRLIPPIAFEDFKALQKIEKTLRLIGMIDFRFYSTPDPPTDINYMNRVFICLPRNFIGLTYFEKHKGQAKFKFSIPGPNSEARLYWRYSTKKIDFIEIRSPLSKYISEQRRIMDYEGEWKKEMGDIIVKDFAILARLKNRVDEPIMRAGCLNDFFIAGIRGLGTWGAAYFIDRNYITFLENPPGEDIQLLLEVTYKRNRISGVIDVSDKPESYFREQNNINIIRKAIADFKKGL